MSNTKFASLATLRQRDLGHQDEDLESIWNTPEGGFGRATPSFLLFPRETVLLLAVGDGPDRLVGKR